MAIETLNIPEEHLATVIAVIRAGVEVVHPPEIVRKPLLAWCNEEEEYLAQIGGGDG